MGSEEEAAGGSRYVQIYRIWMDVPDGRFDVSHSDPGKAAARALQN